MCIRDSCVTPDFPNGTYAYFTTINTTTAELSGPFVRYRKPVFPYVIGDQYTGLPNKFNFDRKSNQDDFSFEGTPWCRNTEPYNLIEDTSVYNYFNIPNDLTQTADVISVAPGTIDNIGISSGGDLYRIGDELDFNNAGTQGDNVKAKVSIIEGKSVESVSVATSSIVGVEFYPSSTEGEYIALAANPHKFAHRDIISVSGLSTTSSGLEGSYDAGISSARLKTVGFGSTSIALKDSAITGFVTFVTLTGPLASIRENDTLGIGTERVKVLNVDTEFSRVRILRAQDGTEAGFHTTGLDVIEDSRRLKFKSGFKSKYNFKNNKQIYFEPSETVGLGTTAVGIGSTVVFSFPGAGLTATRSKDIPIKSLYLKGHGLQTGDVVTYRKGDGDGLVVNEEATIGTATTLTDGQSLFVAKISNDLIGVSTVKVGVGSTGVFVGIASTVRDSRTLFFSGIGTGVYHSLKTNHSVITGDISRNEVTVSLAATHGIQGRHVVFMDVNPSLTTSFSVSYNDYNRRMIIDPKSFTASGISSSTNTFTIVNHGFSNGQKVIHTATSPAEGLEDNKIYYVYEIDKDNFKLTDTYYETTRQKPSVVGITSASSGTISPINPPLKVYRDSTVEFNVSDSSLAYTKQASSYAAFALNFYRDKTFTQLYDKNDESSVFNVVRTGTVGITTDAKVTLTITKDTPNEIFYKLDPVYESDVPVEKSQIINDNEVNLNNQIDVEFSAYSGTCLLYTSPSPRDRTRSRMPSSA